MKRFQWFLIAMLPIFAMSCAGGGSRLNTNDPVAIKNESQVLAQQGLAKVISAGSLVITQANGSAMSTQETAVDKGANTIGVYQMFPGFMSSTTVNAGIEFNAQSGHIYVISSEKNGDRVKFTILDKITGSNVPFGML
jgi:hypothetical protein